MDFIRKIWIITYAVTLVASSTLAFGAHAPALEDVNGDLRIDVQDLQSIVTDVFQGAAPDAGTDVNGDGVTDIFDFQRTVSRTNQAVADSEGDQPATPGVPAGCIFSGHSPQVAQPPLQLVAAVLPQPRVSQPVRLVDESRSRVLLLPQSWQFRCLFTPHGPPSTL